MAHSMSKHVQAKKNFTKVEFKLFSRSFPKEISKISRRSLNSGLLNTEKLVRKYRMKRGKSSRIKAKVLDFRLKHLAQAHERYSKRLDRLDHKYARSAVKQRAATENVTKQKKSMTAQPKMKVELKDSPRNAFLLREQKKLYAKHLKEKRKNELVGAANSKRVGGYISARTRKGQVARDRVTSAKE